jgi:glucokinase
MFTSFSIPRLQPIWIPMSQPECECSVIGVDVGGTKIAAALVKFPKGRANSFRTIPTAAHRGGDAILNDLEGLIADFATEKKSIAGIGIGICELVDNDGQIVSDNCINWRTSTVKSRLSKFGPVKIEADVRAAALAEAHFGRGLNVRSFIYVTVGTGISCCLVLDGKPYTGARGATGTMASGPLFNPYDPNENLISLEQISSGPALVARYAERGFKAGTAQEVFAAAEAGERNAFEIVRSAGHALGGAIGSLVNVLDPELVLLGGGLGSTEGLYRSALIESARQHIWWPGHRELPILSAQTGAMAGVIGAAAAFWVESSVAGR